MSHRNIKGAVGAALLFLGLAGCSEQVAGTLGCPQLCADQSTALRDTILTGAVVIDSTFVGFPRLGETRDFVLLSLGDTADVRIIARYDTLPIRYRVPNAATDSTIRRVDSASFIFRLDTALLKGSGPVTIDAFDVDTTAADTLTSALLPLFRPGRLIGSQTYLPADLKDTMRLTLKDAAVLTKVRDSLRLRIGLQLRGPTASKFRILAGTFPPRIRFRVSADTTVKPDTVFVASATPADDPNLQRALTYYQVVVAGALPPPPLGRLAVGGLSGARSYLRFDIPPIVLDSVQIIRASLLLRQVTPRTLGSALRDTIVLFTQPVLAAPAVMDLFTAATFLGSSAGVDSLRLAPRDTGFHSIELVNLVRTWRSVGTANSTRAIVLRSALEGFTLGELLFVSSEGPVAQRPRLQLTYVPRRGFGIP